jgi:hypothetical protein
MTGPVGGVPVRGVRAERLLWSLRAGEDRARVVVEDFQEVVRGEDERRFALCGTEAMTHEPAKATVLVGVVEDRLDGVRSGRVGRSSGVPPVLLSSSQLVIL